MVYLTALTRLVPHESAAVSARSGYTIQPCTKSPHAKPHASCACVFSCNLHLHFWQKDRDLLRATAVNQWWNGYRNKSQHRKLTLDSNPGPFGHESDALTTELYSLPVFRDTSDYFIVYAVVFVRLIISLCTLLCYYV